MLISYENNSLRWKVPVPMFPLAFIKQFVNKAEDPPDVSGKACSAAASQGVSPLKGVENRINLFQRCYKIVPQTS